MRYTNEFTEVNQNRDLIQDINLLEKVTLSLFVHVLTYVRTYSCVYL